jgi:hypothetical protein
MQFRWAVDEWSNGVGIAQIGEVDLVAKVLVFLPVSLRQVSMRPRPICPEWLLVPDAPKGWQWSKQKTPSKATQERLVVGWYGLRAVGNVGDLNISVSWLNGCRISVIAKIKLDLRNEYWVNASAKRITRGRGECRRITVGKLGQI